ncbi:MAG: WYL domain-containing protein, partial [Clostridia bacterium]
EEQGEILSALHGLTAVKTAQTQALLDKLRLFFHRDAANWIEVDFSDWCDQNSGLFSLLKTAILERHTIAFTYFGATGKQSRRCVEPIQLWFKSQAWYLKAFCLTRGELRTFKLARIRELVMSDEVFPLRDPSTFETQKHPIQEPLPEVRLTLTISSARAYRVYDDFCQNDVACHADGSFTVTVTWPEDEWVYATLLSYGEHIEVVEPAHIRKICVEKASAFVRNHSSPDAPLSGNRAYDGRVERRGEPI